MKPSQLSSDHSIPQSASGSKTDRENLRAEFGVEAFLKGKKVDGQIKK